MMELKIRPKRKSKVAVAVESVVAPKEIKEVEPITLYRSFLSGLSEFEFRADEMFIKSDDRKIELKRKGVLLISYSKKQGRYFDLTSDYKEFMREEEALHLIEKEFINIIKGSVE